MRNKQNKYIFLHSYLGLLLGLFSFFKTDSPIITPTYEILKIVEERHL